MELEVDVELEVLDTCGIGGWRWEVDGRIGF